MQKYPISPRLWAIREELEDISDTSHVNVCWIVIVESEDRLLLQKENKTFAVLKGAQFFDNFLTNTQPRSSEYAKAARQKIYGYPLSLLA